MRPVSAQWLAAITGAHRAVFEVLVVEPGQFGVEPVGTPIPIEGGDVRYDIDSDVLGTVDLVVADPTLFPAEPTDLLAPFGNELYVRRGIDYGTGTTEWVGLGYFRINTVEQTDARGGSFRVAGEDRMCKLIADRMQGGQWLATQTYGSLITELISNDPFLDGTYPGAPIEWDNTAQRDSVIGRQIESDGNRWKLIDDLVKSLSKIWYWDHRGHVIIRDAPDESNPVWTVAAGADGVLVSLGRSITNEGIYNYVHVTGGSPATGDPAPPSNEAYDNNPASPTYYFGPFGRSALFVTEDTATTSAQTTALANRLLREALALPYSLDFTAVPNAALEPYDPVRIRLNADQDSVHVIRTLTIPLDPVQPIQADTRQVQS